MCQLIPQNKLLWKTNLQVEACEDWYEVLRHLLKAMGVCPRPLSFLESETRLGAFFFVLVGVPICVHVDLAPGRLIVLSLLQDMITIMARLFNTAIAGQ